MDLHQRLAEIRDLQGKDPMPDPTKIQGFGPEAPPPPTSHPVQQEWPGDTQEPEDFSEEPSPLIPVVRKVLNPPLNEGRQNAREFLPAPDAGVFVMDGHASFKGFTVDLNQAEQDEVSGVIVRAVRRRLDELSKATINPVQVFTPPIHKKRGRPRKVKS